MFIVNEKSSIGGAACPSIAGPAALAVSSEGKVRPPFLRAPHHAFCPPLLARTLAPASARDERGGTRSTARPPEEWARSPRPGAAHRAFMYDVSLPEFFSVRPPRSVHAPLLHVTPPQPPLPLHRVRAFSRVYFVEPTPLT